MKSISWLRIGLLMLVFVSGYLAGASGNGVQRQEDTINMMPESLSVAPINASVSGSANVFFRRVLPLVEQVLPKALEPVNLSVAPSVALLGDSPLAFTQRSTPVAIIDAASALGGLGVVWTANEIVVGGDPSYEEECSLVASKALLFFALCATGASDMPMGEGEITQAQEIQLMDALVDWGIKDYVARESEPSICQVKGNRYQMEAIRVEVASAFNRNRWKRR